MSLNETFGNNPVQPSQLSLRNVALTANQILQWTFMFPQTDDVVADIMYVTPDADGYTMFMPDALQASNGQQALFNNPSAFSYTVADSVGGTLTVVGPGEAKFIYLRDNTTAAGTWGVFTFGTGSSGADASTLAGLGLFANGLTLSVQHPVQETAVGVTITSAYRASTLIYTGGAGTIDLPDPGTLGNGFFFLLSNQGSSSLAVTPASGLIDGLSSSTFAQGESAFIVCSGTAYYTVGKGEDFTFAFQQVIIDVSGSADYTETSTEASKNIQQYNGVLTGNIDVIVPATPQVYFAFNNTSGAFSLTVKTAAGTGIAITQGDRVILICDGTNIVNGYSSVPGGAISFNNGSQTAPSVNFAGSTNTGLFLDGNNGVGLTAVGTQVAWFDASASAVNYFKFLASAAGTTLKIQAAGADANINISLEPVGTTGRVTTTAGITVAGTVLAADGTFSLPAYSFGSDTNTGFYSVGADTIGVVTGGSRRLVFTSTGHTIIGALTPLTVHNSLSPLLQTQGASGTASSVLASRFSADALAGELVLSKSRNAAVGSNTIVQSGDALGALTMDGADGTGYIRGAQVIAEVDAAPALNSMPSRLRVMTTPTGSTTPVERSRWDSLGNFTVGTAAIATNATAGFPYSPSCVGVPTGVPTTFTGLVPHVYDTASARMYAYMGGAWADVMGQRPKSIEGLTLSNNIADANNDIDVTIGFASDVASPYQPMLLAAAITKRLDATWAVGTNQGGLFSGSKANSTWYHMFLIQRPDTGVVDVGFDTSVTGANAPVAYTRKRRIGAVRTDGSGNILAFSQIGNMVRWITRITDLSTAAPSTGGAFITHTVPTGVNVEALFSAYFEYGGVTNRLLFTSGGPVQETNSIPTASLQDLAISASAVVGAGNFERWTNTSAQTVYRTSSGTAASLVVQTLGYVENL